MITGLKRVVITGVGCVTPLGRDVKTTWKNFLDMQSGIIRLQELEQYRDNQQYPDVYLAPVCEEFKKENHKVPFTNNGLNVYALEAAREAILDSGLDFKKNQELNLRTGVNVGVMSSAIPKLTDIILQAGQKGFNHINRLSILHILSNMPSANVSIKYGLKGPNGTASTACATGASAIGDAYRFIQFGEADVMVAGGTQDSVSPTNIHASIKMQAMSNKKYDNPQFSSRPFDKGRSGFILGEGSGIVILEELEHAKKRKANIYCELIGYGCMSDGFHLTRPQDNGDGALRAMQSALKQANLNYEQIDQINSHATSTPSGDLAELRAIKTLFKGDQELLQKLSITAPQANLGHTFGAAGGIESILAIKSIEQQISPMIKNLDDADDQYREIFKIQQTNEDKKIDFLIKNAFGFGGVNVSLIFKRI